MGAPHVQPGARPSWAAYLPKGVRLLALPVDAAALVRPAWEYGRFSSDVERMVFRNHARSKKRVRWRLAAYSPRQLTQQRVVPLLESTRSRFGSLRDGRFYQSRRQTAGMGRGASQPHPLVYRRCATRRSGSSTAATGGGVTTTSGARKRHVTWWWKCPWDYSGIMHTRDSLQGI